MPVGIQILANGHVSPGYLIQITILLEALQRLLPQPQGKQRIGFYPQLAQCMSATLNKESIIAGSCHQIGQPLQPVTLEIKITFATASHQRLIEFVKFTKMFLFGRVGSTEAG